jgi:hypothetical protein
MTKTKKVTVVAGLAALGLSCVLMGSALAMPIRAFAAGDYNLGANGDNDNEYPVYAGGDAKEGVLKALNDKVKELNTAIDEATADGISLADAYAAGEIVVYSQHEDSADGHLTQDNSRSNWKTWDSTAVADLKYLNAGYGGWGEHYVGWLTYDGGADKAYIVTAEFADYYSGNGKKLGTATSDMFRVENAEGGGYTTYQNFAGGYMKSVNGSVSEVSGKNVTAEGTEVDVNPTDSGYVGAANDAIAQNVGTTNKALNQAFADAYNRYKEDGYNVGYPFSVVKREEGHTWQYFRNGDSVSDPWNDGGRSKWAYLSYNADDATAYLITDEFARLEEMNGDAKKLGSPLGDAFEVDGNRYQNFENGYMKAEGTEPRNTNASMVKGKTMGLDGTESDISIENNIGAFGPTVKDDHIPDNYTRATFSAAFKAAYADKVKYLEGETLAAVAKVVYENGRFSQTYTDNAGKQHRLVYNADQDAFYYLRPAVAEKVTGALGNVTGDRIAVAETDDTTVYAYPFANGYIKLTVSEQAKIEDGQVVTVINEYAVATEGAEYDEEKNYFATTSFSENITPNIVQHTTNGNDASVDDAYWTKWGKEQPSDEVLAAAFKKAYDDAFAIGFSAGTPSPSGILFWKSGQSGVIKLTLKGGNGNANFWGDNTIMLYNPMDGKVYISTGDIANSYANAGASGNGWATTQMKINTVTGVIVQQFDIVDPVVDSRPVYMITADGSTNKVSGVYDFEANANGGEWVDYLTQFGGSISSKPVTLGEYDKGANVSIDFKQYVNNEDGYALGWNLVTENGALSENGVFTLDNIQNNTEVRVEVWSAFDKLTFNVTLAVKGGAPVGPGGDDKPEPEKKGCSSEVGAYGAAAGCLALAAVGAAAVALRKRKEK